MDAGVATLCDSGLGDVVLEREPGADPMVAAVVASSSSMSSEEDVEDVEDEEDGGDSAPLTGSGLGEAVSGSGSTCILMA